MINNKNNTEKEDLNVSNDNTLPKPFFSENPINPLYTNTSKKVLRNNHILNLIKENSPITPYKLTKLVKWSYTEVCRVIRDLEYCGLIQVKIVIGENNRSNKLLTIPNNIQQKDISLTSDLRSSAETKIGDKNESNN